MGRSTFFVLTLATVPMALPAQGQSLCDALRAFERTPLDQSTGRDVPRAVDLFWRGPWGPDNIGYECRHHGDLSARQLCRTLTANMPQ